MSNPLLELFNDVAVSCTPTLAMHKGAFRLDASYYSAQNRAATEAVLNSGRELSPLSELAKIFCSNVRERTFVEPGQGYVLLTGSDLDTTTDADLRHVSMLYTRNYQSEKLRRGDVLISSAGTVGKCDFVWRNHEDRLASQDIIRVRPHPDRIHPGYLYALLSSPIGLALLTNQSAGSVIVRLYTEHLDTVDLPRLEPETEQIIADKVCESFDKRAEASLLLQECTASVLQANALPAIPKTSEEEPDCLSISEKSITSLSPELRLEAHFHNPVVGAALANLRASPSIKRTIGDLSTDVIMGGRFKRNYVEADYGTPFLSGKNIIQIRPTDLKFLSNSQTEDLHDLLVKRGWILVTCSGTIGRTAFVWHNFENYAASQHILRVVPDKDQVDPGYLYAFLASPYGFEQTIRFRHGSVIDEITDHQLSKVVVPLAAEPQQKEIGDKVRLAYLKRAEALESEDQAQEILLREIKGNTTKVNLVCSK